MAGAVQRDGIDAEPQLATCDVCRHRHACYVGGRALGIDAGPALWETHACLGCLMRAAPPAGLDPCGGCPVESGYVPEGSSTNA